MSNNQLRGEKFWCSIKINDIDFNYNNIINLVIREWAFDTLPRLELQINDDGTLVELFPFTDDDVISVEIARDQIDDVNRINVNFDIVDHQYDVIGDNKQLVVNITGILSTVNIFENKTRCFSNTTSLEVLKVIADENKLLFKNPHNITTYDKMTWLQSNQQAYEYIKYVRKRINLPDDVALVYSNCQDEFVVTSLNKEITKPTTYTAKYDTTKFGEIRTEKNADYKTIYFSSYSMKNFFGRSNYNVGYGVGCSWYDYKDVITDEYKNQPASLTDNHYSSEHYRNKIVEYTTFGIMNNVYPDYFKTMARYDYMIKNFFSFALVINCDSNVPIKLCDKINIQFPSKFGKKDDINLVLSGEYLVGGIVHQVSKNGLYLKQLSLHRSGYNNPKSMSE